MKKIWTIAWKDTLVRLRDRNALVFTLLAPLLIAGIMGAALGGNVDGNAATRNLPVLVVNEDTGALGKAFEAALVDAEAGGVLKPSPAQDVTRARAAVERGEAHALIHVPRDFSAALQTPGNTDAAASVELYCGPEVGATAEVVRGVVNHAARRTGALALGRQMAAVRLQRDGAQDPRAAQLDEAFAQEAAAQSQSTAARVEVKSAPASEVKINRNPFAFFAPSLAIFFLMISMFEAPRSILVEQEEGTLGRLVRTPTSPSQILLGKLGGSYLTGILQFAVLVVASRLVFGLTWGQSPSGLALMVVAVVVASASMGAVVAAFSKDVIQAGAFGGGIALISAGLGGNFFAAENLPGWLQVLSRLTINRWALEGFSKLTVHNLEARDVLLNAGVLFGIAAGLFVLAFFKFQRRIAG
jgi:ABC-2 type transport system permease protein